MFIYSLLINLLYGPSMLDALSKSSFAAGTSLYNFPAIPTVCAAHKYSYLLVYVYIDWRQEIIFAPPCPGNINPTL